MQNAMTRYFFKGTGNQSFKVDITENGIVSKKNAIDEYKGMLVNEKECINITKTSNDKVYIDVQEDEVRGVFREVVKDGTKYVEPFYGLAVLIWFQKKKHRRKCHFLWCNVGGKDYHHVKFSCLGIDNEVIFKICDFIFSCLKNLQTPAVADQITQKKEFFDPIEEQVLILEK